MALPHVAILHTTQTGHDGRERRYDDWLKMYSAIYVSTELQVLRKKVRHYVLQPF